MRDTTRISSSPRGGQAAHAFAAPKGHRAAHAFATPGKRQVPHTSTNSEKRQIAYAFALTKILANTPTVPETTQAACAFTAPWGTLGGALFCGFGKNQATYAFPVPKKNIGSKTCTPMP